jgi:hypothetical protein
MTALFNFMNIIDKISSLYTDWKNEDYESCYDHTLLLV